MHSPEVGNCVIVEQDQLSYGRGTASLKLSLFVVKHHMISAEGLLGTDHVSVSLSSDWRRVAVRDACPCPAGQVLPTTTHLGWCIAILLQHQYYVTCIRIVSSDTNTTDHLECRTVVVHSNLFITTFSEMRF